ncbi:MAG TPA: ParB/RepB/Spo0J family partition protein [Candidatus Limnocylindria bacterium]|nr:ParB/RepB/Spo0J family partition protein [Candidatus Limnocylindria bacterium]
MKKPALGRGLDALFPEVSHEGEVVQAPVGLIDPDPDQPRKDFGDASIRELADSLLEVGVLQPLLVSPEGERYRIIAGERRFRAAMLAGLDRVPVLVRTLGEQQRRLATLTENLQRVDLNPIEAAQAVRILIDEDRLTQEEAARRLGKSRPAVANLLRLLKLPQEVLDMVRTGALSEGHARALAGVDDPQRQAALARMAVQRGLSVRELEALARQDPKPAARPARQAPLEFADFQDRLEQALGLRAQVSGSLDKGRIVLTYRNRDELEGIWEAVTKLLD